MKETFIIVTGDAYPEENAGAVRTHVFAKILSELGYSPFIIGMGNPTSFQIKEHDGIPYCSLRYARKDLFSKLASRVLFGHNVKKAAKHCDMSKIEGIMYVSGGGVVLRYVKKLSKQYGIPLYFDSVEWYSPSEFRMGVFSPAYIANNHLNTYGIDRNFRVFSISTFLEDHFNKRGISTVRIPVIMDVQSMSACVTREVSDTSEKIRIVYAGSPGKKDHLSELVKAIALLSAEEQNKIDFHVIGMTLEKYLQVYAIASPDDIPRSVMFDGRKPRSEVLRQVAGADFAFLLRPSDERYAKAGFPTKVVESLSLGTPMLCNLSSDLAIYLKDGENSILINDCSADACCSALRRILALSREQMNRMRLSARKTAEDAFDWRKYKEEVSMFIKKQ